MPLKNCWWRMCANAAVRIAGAWQVVLRIRDVYPVSRIRIFSWIRIKEFKYFNPDPDPDFLPIPDPGVKKARIRIPTLPASVPNPL
jgi:hypothetical protein